MFAAKSWFSRATNGRPARSISASTSTSRYIMMRIASESSMFISLHRSTSDPSRCEHSSVPDRDEREK